MTIEEGITGAGAEKADTPEAHKRGLRAKGPHRRLRAWGAPGQTCGCPSVAGRPKVAPRSPQVFPGRQAAASRWRTMSA